jgi:hypothetical protein
MHTFESRFTSGLTLVVLLLSGPTLACEPPVGFVNPPRPDIAPLEELLAHTEQSDIALSLAALSQRPSRPLSEGIRPTRDLPGVSGTFNLTSRGYGTVGARRLVCLTDGSIAVEEVLHAESNSESRRFRYVVWNYTSPKFRDVHYAVGEFIHTQPAPEKTRVNWTYRFALKEGRDPGLFRKTFLDSVFAEWMRSILERGRLHAEGAPATAPQ